MENTTVKCQEIAVIGSGIAGMSAARLLSKNHRITLFEANDYIGGHTHTLMVEKNDERYPVDTGFIVFNDKTYPSFMRLLERLGIEKQPTSMSFGIKSEGNGLEYCATSLNTFFAQRKNLLSIGFYKMIADIFRFKRRFRPFLDTNDYTTTLGEYLFETGYSPQFIRHFVVPMGAAIWSCGENDVLRFPAYFFIHFFHHHGFLNVLNQPQWYVIKGGSYRYVEKLTAPYADRIHLNTRVAKVKRFPDGVEVKTAGGETHRFDQVVIAVHADQALRMLSDANELEDELLSAFKYQPNDTCLHSDVSILPRQKRARASWNYMTGSGSDKAVTVSYDMNRLQSLDNGHPFIVSLNLPVEIDGEKVMARMVYHHPVYSREAIEAQKYHHLINGVNRTYFCGAYWGYGFHEDGLVSALKVAEYFGLSLEDI